MHVPAKATLRSGELLGEKGCPGVARPSDAVAPPRGPLICHTASTPPTDGLAFCHTSHPSLRALLPSPDIGGLAATGLKALGQARGDETQPLSRSCLSFSREVNFFVLQEDGESILGGHGSRWDGGHQICRDLTAPSVTPRWAQDIGT